MNDIYYPLIGSKCFGLSPVRHQEHHLINCITHWYVRAQASLAVAWMYIHATARLACNALYSL